MSVKFWSNVQVAVQSAIASTIAITGITKANPGVVSHGGADPSNGDYVYLAVQGMHQLNNRVARVANVASGTFELEGIDTSAFTDFTSGTFQVLTLGTTLSTITGLNASGGDPEFEDITTIHDNVRTQVPVVSSPLTFSMESIWDPADAGLQALKDASDNLERRAVMLTFAGGFKCLFTGYINAALLPTGSGQAKVTTSVTITVEGKPTYYNS